MKRGSRMYTNYLQMREALQFGTPSKVAVAAAHDEAIIQTVIDAHALHNIESILVGDAEKINTLIDKLSYRFGFHPEVIHETDEKKAASIAAQLVGAGKAHVLMKGLLNSSDFLHAILDDQIGLKRDGLLSHFASFEIPGQKKLVFYTDGGMNPFPNLDKKTQLVRNGIDALHTLGIEMPNVAILTANEKVTSSMPATLDATQLVEMNCNGNFPPCIMEGPITLDVALSPEAAFHKGIKSQISGSVDLFVVPNIEAGNMIGKTLIYCAGAKMAGVVLGANCPIVMTSRAENPEGKLNSLALACLLKGIK